MFFLTTAALLTLASALDINIGNYTIHVPIPPKPVKAARQPGCSPAKNLKVAGRLQEKNGDECSFSTNGIYYLCGQYTYEQAAAACTDHGWRLAVVDDSNKLDVNDVINQCASFIPAAWIASFNGLEGEDCAVAVGEFGLAINGLPETICESSLNVICQDIPVETVTDSIAVSTSTVEAIRTKTVEIEPTCPPRHIKPCPRKNKNSDFVLIDTPLPHYQAQCACHELGLELANLNIQNFMDASSELWEHLGPRKHAWIRSWNGDKYEVQDCLALWTGSTGPNGAIAVPNSCQKRIPVLCQKKKHHHCDCHDTSRPCICSDHHGRHPHHRILLEQPAGREAEIKEGGQDKCLDGHFCPPVCKYRTDNIRLVKSNSTAYEAEEVCRQFGWNLLNLSKDNQREVTKIRNKCNICNSLWIKSFEGVDGAACMLTIPLSFGPSKDGKVIAGHNHLNDAAGYVFTADSCVEIGALHVLCEVDCHPVETSSGTFSGEYSTTTFTTSFTTVTTQFTATVTTTVTLLE